MIFQHLFEVSTLTNFDNSLSFDFAPTNDYDKVLNSLASNFAHSFCFKWSNSWVKFDEKANSLIAIAKK